MAGRRVLAVGQTGTENKPDPNSRPFLMVLEVDDGKELWRADLPSPATKAGVAVDHRGRIFVTLQNGQLMCFNPVPLQAQARSVLGRWTVGGSADRGSQFAVRRR
jgi:outer membrane protein assembly factor BamB